MKKSILISIVLFFAIFQAKSQNDPCNCDKALIPNFREEFETIYSTKYDESLKVLFEHEFKFWEDGEWKNDKSLESGGSYGLYSGFFNASDSRAEKQVKFESEKSQYEVDKDISTSAYQYMSQKTPSAKAYQAWLGCKQSCQNFYGVILSKEVNGKDVLVRLYFKQRNNTIKEKISSITLSNLKTVDGNVLKRNKSIKGQNTYTGKFEKVKIDEDAIMTIDVSNYETETLLFPAPANTIKNPLEDAMTTKIEISNGDLKENSKLNADWGIKDPDVEGPLALQWRAVPLGPTTHYHEAAWVSTQATAGKRSVTPLHYVWEFEMLNRLGGKSGPNGRGGSGEALPAYRTNISLPKLNGTRSYFTLKVSGSCLAPEAAEPNGLGKDITITINGKDVQKLLKFPVTNDLKVSTITVDNLAPGNYALDMQMPKILAGSAGLHVNDPNAARTMNFTTKLSVDISVREISDPRPAPDPVPRSTSNAWIWYSAGGLLLAVILSAIFFKRKK